MIASEQGQAGAAATGVNMEPEFSTEEAESRRFYDIKVADPIVLRRDFSDGWLPFGHESIFFAGFGGDAYETAGLGAQYAEKVWKFRAYIFAYLLSFVIYFECDSPPTGWGSGKCFGFSG